MNQTMATIAVVAATTATVALLIPQIIKLIRTGDSAGVSSIWPSLGFVSNVGWLAYMVSQHFWIATVAPLSAVITYGVTLRVLSSTGRSLRPSYVSGLIWTVLLAATGLMGGWLTLGVVLGLTYGVQLAPAVVSAYRTANPSGIAPGTWWIGLVEALLWGYFGLFHRNPGILTFSVVALIGTGAILFRYYAARAAQSRKLTPLATADGILGLQGEVLTPPGFEEPVGETNWPRTLAVPPHHGGGSLGEGDGGVELADQVP